MPAEGLSGASLANQILDSCSSTNDVAKRLAEEGFPQGTWVSARTQGAGRGRLGRKWESLAGNLFLSFIVRLEDRSKWSWVPLTSAVAVVTALKPLFPNLPFRIKWPNDICISSESGGVKLGGVLCEASSSAERSFIIVGLGLNCAEAPALGTVNQQVGHLSEYASGFDPDLKVNADRVRGPIVDSLRFCFERLAREGKGWVSAEYQHLALFQEGTALTWSPFIEQGVVLGLGDLAELRVRSSLGEVRSLYSEEVKVRKIKPSVRDQIRGDEFLL